MGTLTIRQLDEETQHRLQVRAAQNGRSMEAEVRAILEEAVSEESTSEGPSLGEVMAEFRRRTGGVELDLPRRDDFGDRRIPDFS